ncbi:hypothetical protein STEG23_003939, partial [Scotinomys teguina]
MRLNPSKGGNWTPTEMAECEALTKGGCRQQVELAEEGGHVGHSWQEPLTLVPCDLDAIQEAIGCLSQCSIAVKRHHDDK